MPKLELWQPPNERPKFFVVFLRQGRLAVLQAVALGKGRIKFRLQKGEEEVEQVDAEGVADCLR